MENQLPLNFHTKDYYSQLGVAKCSTPRQIKAAYRKQAKKWHPDKNPGNTDAAAEKFKEISEAYSVLSDARQRQMYNLKKGVPTRPRASAASYAWGAQASSSSSTGSRKRGYDAPRYDPYEELKRRRRAEQQKHDAKRAANAQAQYAAAKAEADAAAARAKAAAKERAARWAQPPTSGARSHPYPTRSSTGSSYGGYGAAAPAPVQTKLKKQAPIVRDFFCSLEELYNGCEKRMRVTKRVIGSTGVAKHEKKDLVIPVKPGWKAGTKVTFEKEGDHIAGTTPADIQFILKEMPHERFRRVDNDLHIVMPITVEDAMCGCTLEIPTLAKHGRPTALPIEPLGTSNKTMLFKDMGMPITKAPGQFGKLQIRFIVTFQTVPVARRSEAKGAMQQVWKKLQQGRPL